MSLTQIVEAVDSHTMGEPTRIVVGGTGDIPGATMGEKKRYLQERMDYLRASLMREPRGHRDMFGAVLTAPTSEDADTGIVFMDHDGYVNMCGHGTIGAVTVLLERELVSPKKNDGSVVLDTPGGKVQCRATTVGKRVTSVTVKNVPAFVWKANHPLKLSDGRTISVDIAWGGNFFAIVSAAETGVPVEMGNIKKLVSLGMEIKERINEEVPVRHPVETHANRIDLVEFSDKPAAPGAHVKNVVIFGEGEVDRSPCGTGTSAKMASLFFKGKLALGQEFVHESIIGTCFSGRLLGETRVGDFPAVFPEITGQAFITGIQQFVIQPDDPFKYGFKVG